MLAKERNTVKELQYVTEVLRSSICDLHFADGWIYVQLHMAFRCDSLLDFHPVMRNPVLFLCARLAPIVLGNAHARFTNRRHQIFFKDGWGHTLLLTRLPDRSGIVRCDFPGRSVRTAGLCFFACHDAAFPWK